MSSGQTAEQPTDLELLRRTQVSQADFKLLVDRYWKRLYVFVKRLYFFEHEDIQDIVQEACIKLYRNLHAYDPSFAFSTWLFQITRNCAIDALRKKRLRPQTVVLEDEEWERLSCAADDGEHHATRAEDIQRAIAQLPLKYREAFTLFYLEQRTYEEMIDILKKPKGTIASLISRAKQLVRQQLQHSSSL